MLVTDLTSVLDGASGGVPGKYEVSTRILGKTMRDEGRNEEKVE